MRLALRRLFSLVVTIVFCTAAFAGEGFGIVKKTAKLTRVHPPQIFISGTKIAVRGGSPSSKYATAAQRLQAQLESELIGAEPRFKLESTKPETIVDVTVLQSDYGDEWQTRQGTQRVKTGSVDSKGKPIYEDRQVTYRVKIVNYTFAAAYKVLDAKGNRSLAADSISRPFRQEFTEGNGAPDPSSLENDAVNALVADLTHRLARTQEVIGVLLPKGTMEASIPLADAGLWTKYLDSLDKIPPLAKPTDEAYRQYALGVAYEALGYGADDVDQTLKYLEEASTHYNNAVDTHPKEPNFTKPYDSFIFRGKGAEAPLSRVQEALVQYQKLKEFAELSSRTTPSVATGSKSAGDGVPSNALTNAGLVDMLQAGLPEEVILTAIDSAPQTAFDVTPKGLIELAEAKASKKLLQRVQAAASKSSGSGTKTAKAKKSSPK